MYDYVGPPLNRELLASVLAANGIAERAYHLYGAHQDNALVLDNRPQGWVVFYSERGGEDILSTYASEADACLDLLNRLLDDTWNHFELVAGPALPAAADAEFVAWLHAHGLSRDDLEDVDVRMQDTPWKVAEPDYRRYWVHSRHVRRASL